MSIRCSLLPSQIASADVARFFIWFELAEKFIVTFLDLDEELIMKPVDGVTTLPNILNKESRAEEKQAIRDTFAVINTYRVEAAVIKEDDSSFDHFLQSCRILGSRLGKHRIQHAHWRLRIHPSIWQEMSSWGPFANALRNFILFLCSELPLHEGKVHPPADFSVFK
mmetsp:Transcript_33256/g.130919  ORF Transcript_33256/g.130919 Transcript_33256/m.130919 type:complete len:167 (+) Transcript_33256:881-1381(+)